MSPKRSTPKGVAPVQVFEALGEPTRMRLVDRLGLESPCSISQLTEGLGISRQAVTKHLAVLDRAGLVDSKRVGREHQFSVRLQAIRDARDYLNRASRQWDQALARLRSCVED